MNHHQPPDLEHLEALVASDHAWRAVEHLEALLASGSRRAGPKRRYTLMDVVVTEAAAVLWGSARGAVRNLNDPECWERLRRAAAEAFPNSRRRLSQDAPSRQQLYRALQSAFRGEALDMFMRHARAESVAAATRMGMFDPTRGGWTHPHASQVLAGDGTRFLGHRLVVLAGRASDGSIVFDAGLAPSDTSSDGVEPTETDQVLAMLRRLLDETGDILQPGLRGLAYDMSMSLGAIDRVLDLGVLPIVKVPKAPGGELRCVNLGKLPFTTVDGATHSLVVKVIDGAPAVAFTDSAGVDQLLRLRRERILWGRGERRIAYGRYLVPSELAVPEHLRGASTMIRFNSTPEEVHSGSGRRCHGLRPIPQSDEAFHRIYSVRADAEALCADLRRNRHLKRLQDDRLKFSITCYQLLLLAVAVAAYYRRRRGNDAAA